MRKTMMLFPAMTLIAFAYMSTSVFAGGMKDPMGKAPQEVTLVWLGKEVKNAEGAYLGKVRDFVWDSEGRISFAIVSRGGFLGFLKKRSPFLIVPSRMTKKNNISPVLSVMIGSPMHLSLKTKRICTTLFLRDPYTGTLGCSLTGPKSPWRGSEARIIMSNTKMGRPEKEREGIPLAL